MIQALDLWSGTSVTRAVNVLRYILSKIIDTCNKSSMTFDEYCFISPKKAKHLVVLDPMIKRAHTGIVGMKHRIIKKKLHILTGVVTLFVLPQDYSGSYDSSCKFIGVNRQGNYTAHDLENRAVYDKYLQLTEDIVPGDMVLCRDGFGELTSESKKSITIILEPWK